MKRHAYVKTIHNSRYQALRQLLLEAREAAGLTQKELATRLGRPQSFVSKTENAERRLDVIEFLEVCEGIGVDPYGVLRGVEATHPIA
ncbi:helix-turn-helix domain-containing protein [Pseudomonas cichorii]|uniref:helix-turn-helix domain-containing protein n=1 Tax=Pseudomonas cichorii TaxID=36746 RepID=UPI0027E1013E|nr:helix-turn-helix transcriptional regulator [Pseudomonas cichorii]